MTHKRALAIAALTLAGTLALTSCSTKPGAQADALPTPSASDVAPMPTPSSSESGPREAAPVPTVKAEISAPVDFDTGITVLLTSVTATSVKAETPGEVDGPAVVVTVEAQNNSTSEQQLDSAVVTLVAEDGAYGVGTTAGGGTALAGTIAPGASASGTYVFMLDPAAGRTVTVSVNYAAGEPLAEFSGRVS